MINLGKFHGQNDCIIQYFVGLRICSQEHGERDQRPSSLCPETEREVPFLGAQNTETDTWAHFVGRNTLLQSMRKAINPKERSKNLLTDVGRYEETQQIWSILHFIEAIVIYQKSLAKPLLHSLAQKYEERRKVPGKNIFLPNGCCIYPSLKAQLNQEFPKEYKTESWSTSNSVRKGQKTHRREEKGKERREQMERRNDLNLQ